MNSRKITTSAALAAASTTSTMADEEPGAIAVAPPPGCVYDERTPDEVDLDAIVRDVTDAAVGPLVGTVRQPTSMKEDAP
jgi:hypothetical protein